MERRYATQMEAARQGIVTPELETVAKKEQMRVEELLPLVAQKLGEWKGLAPEAVAEATFRNAVEFFGLEKEMAEP